MRINSRHLLRVLIVIVLGASWASAEEPAKTAPPAADPAKVQTTTQPLAKESSPAAATQFTVVVGAAGTDEYRIVFAEWTDQWKQIAKHADVPFVLIGESNDSGSGSGNDIDAFKKRIQAIQSEPGITHWVILIGHGTYDGRTTKFNLRGPDVSAAEFANWLNEKPAIAPDKSRNNALVIVNCTSSSSPFINALSGPGRVIVTATQNGTEQNFARFGKYFTNAMQSLESDLDHDQEVSVLEAFLSASKNTQRFYDAESRIATEHALIDDNGDGRGTRAEAFRATRVVAKAKKDAEVDGKAARRITLAVGSDTSPANAPMLSSQQKMKREVLENRVEMLHERKEQMQLVDYYDQLEPLMIELAELYQLPAQ